MRTKRRLEKRAESGSFKSSDRKFSEEWQNSFQGRIRRSVWWLLTTIGQSLYKCKIQLTTLVSSDFAGFALKCGELGPEMLRLDERKTRRIHWRWNLQFVLHALKQLGAIYPPNIVFPWHPRLSVCTIHRIQMRR